MESNWRIIALAGWLLILWMWENLSPLRTHDRKHMWANTLFSFLTIFTNALLVVLLIAIIEDPFYPCGKGALLLTYHSVI
jgi:hypothetical protein